MHACAQAGTIVPHSFYLQAVEMRRFVTIGKVHACNYLSTNYRYARTVKGIYRKPKLLREESEVTDVFATAIIGKGKESEERTPLQVPVASTSHIGGSKEAWSWIPPVSRDGPSKVIEKNKLEIKKGVYLSADEVKGYLESNGAENVIVLTLKEPLDTINSFVIGSASSSRLIRRLLEAVVDNLKKRELSKVIGASGIEGDKTDDWQVLDCHSFLVHMMLPETRKHLDLESHWSAETRPCLAFSKSDKELSQRMDELLDKYPVPGEYAESLRGTNNISYQGEVKVL